LYTQNFQNKKKPRIDLDEIIDAFKINVESVETVKYSGLNKSTRVYRVNKVKSFDELYIVDTPSGRDVACNPQIVGKELTSACFKAALEAVKIINSLTKIEKKKHVVIEHVLRAAPGYCLDKAFKIINKRKQLREVWVTPRYTKPSYRDHGENTRKLEVAYEDFTRLPQNSDFTLLKPDTEATGETSRLALNRIMEHTKRVNSRIERVILYGFISQDSLKIIKKIAREGGFEILALALEDVMELAFNNYDMTLYGLDLSYWEKYQKRRKLSSIVPVEVLEDLISNFAPGSDQPGDFSSRQMRIFDGRQWRTGPIFCHLINSLRLLSKLRRITEDEPWYQHHEVFERKMKKLWWKIVKYLPHSLLYPRRTFSCMKG